MIWTQIEDNMVCPLGSYGNKVSRIFVSIWGDDGTSYVAECGCTYHLKGESI